MSLLKHVLIAFLKVTRKKRSYMDVERFRRRVEKEVTVGEVAPPPRLKERCHVIKTTLGDHLVYILRPTYLLREGETKAAKTIFYLHGGCYTFEIEPEHWTFCAWMTEALGVDVVLPIYPLAPLSTVTETLPWVMRAYEQAGEGTEILAIMGDSAGAGMALALTQQVSKNAPKHVVLLSPWVDIEMNHPEIPAYDARDPWLSRVGLVEAGHLYRGRGRKGAAGEVSASDPRVSPINGELKGLPPITIVIGARDILVPDARLLKQKAEAAGTKTTLHEHEDMVHDFMLIDLLPEAALARIQIKSALTT